MKIQKIEERLNIGAAKRYEKLSIVFNFFGVCIHFMNPDYPNHQEILFETYFCLYKTWFQKNRKYLKFVMPWNMIN